MINPSIETDLVGDIVEVIEVRSRYGTNGEGQHVRLGTHRELVGRGRCRAVTAIGNHLNLWLEVFDQECQNAWAYDAPYIGDVIVIGTESIESSHQRIIKLVKDYSK